MNISDATKESYSLWHNAPYDCDQKRLALALRDALAESLKAEFYQEHERTKITMLCQTCVLSDIEDHDPRHKWNDTDWKVEAHNRLMEGIGK